ncbi:MAG: ferrous iron transport protein B, partial [Deltaproteobacteria bacterium]|nr:ferrous iron transport protein B [Deltaproteobacteria bacterium]
MKNRITVALAGNPNSGKTTLFNNLTGMHQHTGNWPGKTVEKKEGSFKYKDRLFSVIDLPGIYSLTPYSVEEVIARDYIAEKNPDVVINIVDACNLERNLYLTVQLIEMGARVVELLNALCRASKQPQNAAKMLEYHREIEEHIVDIVQVIENRVVVYKHLPTRWVALKLIEDDEEVIKDILKQKDGQEILSKVKRLQKHLSQVFGDSVDTAVAESRYGFIAGLLKECLKKPPVDRVTMSDHIDRVVTHKYLGIPIFLFVMWLMFQVTFVLSKPLSKLIEAAFDWLGATLGGLIKVGWLSSFVANGIIGGVGSVLMFVPVIFLLFLAIALLEDCGYLSRAAFIMDRLMHKIGLHGKSFIPLLLGFGCNVPAIMATRTLRNRRDRLLTILIIPFMSCGARLPVYALFSAALFSRHQGWVIFSLYLLGLLIAILTGLLLNRTIFKGVSSPFVMELPPYRLPTVRGAI